jgi:Uma2 family endonuclease
MSRAALQIDKHLPATLTAPGLTEAEFLALAEEFPDATLEYTADGVVLIIPFTDPDSSAGVAQIVCQLAEWAAQDKRGMVVGPDGGFFFPNGSRRSPDAAWFDTRRWRNSQVPGTMFPVFAPEFLIEVRSPKQRAAPLRDKMAEYIENGVKLAWLIDPLDRTVTIYKPHRKPKVLTHPATVAGEGLVEGFVLNLDGILRT